MDYKFAGAGSVPGGEYDAVSVSGSTRVNGRVRCRSFRASGSVGGDGSIDCTGEVHFSGSVSLGGDVSAALLKASGAFKCAGSLRCGEMSASGAVHVGGGIEGDRVTVRGALSCEGLLNAEVIDIEPDGLSQVGSIGGSGIRIAPGPLARAGSGISRFFGKGKTRSLTVREAIEGDEIYLENVTAPQVVGRKVVIGPGCRIGQLRYSESADVSPEAEVENTEQI